jgi:hypothetical protein
MINKEKLYLISWSFITALLVLIFVSSLASVSEVQNVSSKTLYEFIMYIATTINVGSYPNTYGTLR